MSSDYDEHVRANGLIFVPKLGYVSPQMHAGMVRNHEQWEKDEREIAAILAADYAGES